MAWIQRSPTQYVNTLTAMQLVFQQGVWILSKYDETSSQNLVSLDDLFGNPVLPVNPIEDSVVIWDETGTIPDSFLTFPLAYAAFAVLPTGSTLFIYSDGASIPVIPAGTYDMRFGSLANVGPVDVFDVSMDDGVIFENLRTVFHFFITSNCAFDP